MKFLLDTKVVAEWVKPRPEPLVVSWLAETDEDRIFLSVATLAEILYGVEAMAAAGRRKRLASWLADELVSRFEGRVLDIDADIAFDCGVLMARARKLGVTMGTTDAFFAATARVHDLRLITRNARDFRAAEIEVFDPWNNARRHE